MASKWDDEIKRKAQMGIALTNPTAESQKLYDQYKSTMTSKKGNTSGAKAPNYIKPTDWNETIRKAQLNIPLVTPTGEKTEVYNNYQNLSNLKAPTRDPYQSKYQGKIDSVLDELLNSKFNYDVNEDPLYAQYKQMYNREGDRAYENAMGEAASLTGGRPSSYAMTAGQQAQNYYSTQLNDKVPELYDAAYGRYMKDLGMKQSNIGIMGNLDAADYGKYMDALNYDRTAYENDRNYYRGNYESDRNFNYSAFLDDRNFGYQQDRDKVSDGQWNKTFDRNVFESDRGFNRGVLESDRNYNRGVLESDRSYGLSQSKFNYQKEQDKKTKKEKQEEADVLGALYQGMMQAEDPKEWLVEHAPSLTTSELNALYGKLPKSNDPYDIWLEQTLKAGLGK